jgi:hypothetical protein
MKKIRQPSMACRIVGTIFPYLCAAVILSAGAMTKITHMATVSGIWMNIYAKSPD